jgi:hypothetical protein
MQNQHLGRAAAGRVVAVAVAGLLFAAVAVAASAHPVANGHYAGRTTQRQATTIAVSANAT